MKWKFSPLPDDQVESEITQRDHFNNDEVNLSETIVREAVQNSLDAMAAGTTTINVRFSFVTKENGLDPSFFKELFTGQLEHAELSGISVESLDFDAPEALIIEDFGTDGLTGSVNSKDKENFSDFWRRHGKSHKHGAKRGRWGLGKLVYSTSSRARVFFGITKRNNDPELYLMGQTVLNTRKIDDLSYPAHNFFSDYIHEHNHIKRMPVPVEDTGIKNSFIDNFNLKRGSQSGLSIIIPFPNKSFNTTEMIGVAISNYFYPILTGQLILNFDSTEINKENIRELARIYAKNMFPQLDLLFDFIEEVYNADKNTLLQLNPTWINNSVLSEQDFDESQLTIARENYKKGNIIGINLPVKVKKKGELGKESSFTVFLKKPYELEKGLDIYVRGGLTLPGESKFRDRKALGAMIAEDEVVCNLLGDAENAAHTQWTMRTEKLSKNYESPGKLVKAIKQSILSLYRILAEVIEERDENALMDFFWYRTPEKTPRKKKRKKPNPPVPPKPKSKKRIQITKSENGFSLSNAEGMKIEELPYEQKVKVAYDVIKGKPLDRYNSLDFTVGTGGSIITEEKIGTTVIKSGKNEWILRIESLPFSFSVSGFDTNRDLVVVLPEVKKNAEEN